LIASATIVIRLAFLRTFFFISLGTIWCLFIGSFCRRRLVFGNFFFAFLILVSRTFLTFVGEGKTLLFQIEDDSINLLVKDADVLIEPR
jgi:hypothetical protein